MRNTTFSLNSRPASIVWLLALAGSTIWFSWVCARSAIGGYYSRALDEGHLSRSISFEPLNAEPHFRLGVRRLLADLDPEAAVTELNRALQLNPHDSRGWLALQQAYLVLGDPQQRKVALLNAEQSDPTSPRVQWELANYYFMQDDKAAALAHAKRVFLGPEVLVDEKGSAQRSLEAGALRLAWRSMPDMNYLLDNVVPRNADDYLILLDIVVTDISQSQTESLDIEGQDQPVAFNWRDQVRRSWRFATRHDDATSGMQQSGTTDSSSADNSENSQTRPSNSSAVPENTTQVAAAKELWRRFQAFGTTGKEYRPERAYPFVLFMIAQHEPDAALQVWQQLTAGSKITAESREPGNLLLNGSFEHDILSSGFDWTILSVPAVKANLDRSVSHTGRQSLSIYFDQVITDDSGVVQFVPVKSNTKYQFNSFLRSRDLFSQSGPRWCVEDPYARKLYLESEPFLGDLEWTPYSGNFVTGADTKLLVVRICRDPAEKPVEGRLWIDDVSLTESN